jgi:hypothetical protein
MLSAGGIVMVNGIALSGSQYVVGHMPDNRRALKGVFVQGVRLAVKGGLVGLVLNAVDGRKIRADVSRESGLHEERLKDLLKRLNESVEEVCDQIEEAEEKEEGEEYRLPDNLAKEERLRDFIREGLEQLEKEGESHLSLTDKEARMMITGEGIKFAYHAIGRSAYGGQCSGGGGCKNWGDSWGGGGAGGVGQL